MRRSKYIIFKSDAGNEPAEAVNKLFSCHLSVRDFTNAMHQAFEQEEEEEWCLWREADATKFSVYIKSKGEVVTQLLWTINRMCLLWPSLGWLPRTGTMFYQLCVHLDTQAFMNPGAVGEVEVFQWYSNHRLVCSGWQTCLHLNRLSSWIRLLPTTLGVFASWSFTAPLSN